MPTLFFLKKIFARLFFPMPLMTFAGVIALILAFRKKGSPRQKAIGKWMLIAWMATFYLIGLRGHLPANKLDWRYPSLKLDQLDTSQEYTVCVFGSSYHPYRSLPPEKRFCDTFQLRLLEAMRICRFLEKEGIPYRLVVSVQTFSNVPMENRLADLYAFTDMFGLPREKISLLRDRSYNTRLEMIAFKEYPGRKILISNGWHLPRINLLARKYDVTDTISAPCVTTSGGGGYGHVLPNEDAFYKLRIYAYETLGRLEVLLF